MSNNTTEGTKLKDVNNIDDILSKQNQNQNQNQNQKKKKRKTERSTNKNQTPVNISNISNNSDTSDTPDILVDTNVDNSNNGQSGIGNNVDDTNEEYNAVEVITNTDEYEDENEKKTFGESIKDAYRTTKQKIFDNKFKILLVLIIFGLLLVVLLSYFYSDTQVVYFTGVWYDAFKNKLVIDPGVNPVTADDYKTNVNITFYLQFPESDDENSEQLDEPVQMYGQYNIRSTGKNIPLYKLFNTVKKYNFYPSGTTGYDSPKLHVTRTSDGKIRIKNEITNDESVFFKDNNETYNMFPYLIYYE